MRRLLLSTLPFALLVTTEPLFAQIDRITGKNFATRSEVLARHGMVCTSLPGTVDAWAQLQKKFGKLKLSDDLAPALRYAEEGFPVTELIAYYWERSVPLYKNMPGGFLETYTLDGKGRAPAKGDIFKNPALAKSLRLIGEKGRDAFYTGEIADKIDNFMQANGGFLCKTDFEKHTSTWVDPVSVNYRGYEVFELPPNGQGIATLQMLNILEGFDLRAMGFGSAQALHTMIEAKKIAWADRDKFYAEPAFTKIPLAGLLSKSYAAERRRLIDPNRAAKKVEGGQPSGLSGQTGFQPVIPVDQARRLLATTGEDASLPQ